MVALTENKEVNEKDGKVVSMPVAVDIIYKGALVKVNAAGFLAPCAAEAGAIFAGVAYEKCDNSAGSAGDKECLVFVDDRLFLLTVAGFAQTDVGDLVYASDDQTISKTQGANEQEIGRVERFVSATQVWVRSTASRQNI